MIYELLFYGIWWEVDSVVILFSVVILNCHLKLFDQCIDLAFTASMFDMQTRLSSPVS